MFREFPLTTLYSVLFLGTLIFTIVLNNILIRFLKTLGTKDQPGKVMIRWSSQSKPAIGGIAFFICFLLSLSAGAFLSETEWLTKLQLFGWIFAGTIAFVSGLADDAFNTKPLLKFGAQLACGVVLVATGTVIQVVDVYWIDVLLTLFWVVGMMNSINMLDNMDAITTIVSIFVFIFFLLLLSISGGIASFPMIVFIGLTGTLFGFLVHNWHPSKIYMGDSGSQFLGLLIAAASVVFCWNIDFTEEGAADIRNVLLPIMVLLLPIADTTLVTVNRILHKQSPFVGGRDHSTHNMSYLGMRDNFVAVTYSFLGMIQLVFAMGVVLFIREWSFLWTIVYIVWIAFVILMMFMIAWNNRKKNRYNYEKH